MVFQHKPTPHWAGTVGTAFGRGQSSVAIRTAEREAFVLVTTDIGKFEKNEMEVSRHRGIFTLRLVSAVRTIQRQCLPLPQLSVWYWGTQSDHCGLFLRLSLRVPLDPLVKWEKYLMWPHMKISYDLSPVFEGEQIPVFCAGPSGQKMQPGLMSWKRTFPGHDLGV